MSNICPTIVELESIALATILNQDTVAYSQESRGSPLHVLPVAEHVCAGSGVCGNISTASGLVNISTASGLVNSSTASGLVNSSQSSWFEPQKCLSGSLLVHIFEV